jgi:putative ABC transport system permease protein
LEFGTYVCGIFAALVIFYTNSFLLKQRSRELGLYSILGLEKGHIAKVLFWENCIIGLTGLVGGLLIGILFSRLMSLILFKMIGTSVKLDFMIPKTAILNTTILFLAVYLVNFFVANIRVARLKPIELLQSGKKGEKEPKANWLLALLGIASLGIGYYLSVTTKNPIKALNTFFIAILGTYLLFVSGSVMLLKILKKNKRFYYHKSHFITVSGMSYRMKRNAVGLANICILSTAVLIILSSTISLYAGIEDVLRLQYPRNMRIVCDAHKAELNIEKMEKIIQQKVKEAGKETLQVKKGYSFNYLGCKGEKNHYMIAGTFNEDNMQYLTMYSLEEYNQLADNKNKLGKLGKNEIWAYDEKGTLKDGQKIFLADENYTVHILKKEEFQKMRNQKQGLYFDIDESSLGETINFFLPNLKELYKMQKKAKELEKKGSFSYPTMQYAYAFNMSEKNVKKMETFVDTLEKTLKEADISCEIRSLVINRDGFYGIFASLFFIGIFIGSIFLMTTVLIIYYKQISEGYEDKERFEILQKVGMSQKEVKKVIHSQILQVFFLPILLASLHIAFAFPCVKKILEMFFMSNTMLFIGCTVGSILLFTIVYAIVYKLTAKTYYKIVYGNI